MRVGNWRHDLKSSLRSDCKRPQGQDKDSILILWTMIAMSDLVWEHSIWDLESSSHPLFFERPGKPDQGKLTCSKLQWSSGTELGWAHWFANWEPGAGLPIAGRRQYMAYTPPPSPSPMADISNWSGHSFLLNPDLTILNTAFQSLPAGWAAPGGETLSLADLIQECLLWNSYRE